MKTNGAKILKDKSLEREEYQVLTRRAESAENYLQQILSTIRSIFIGLDNSGCVRHWNKEAEATFGLSLAEVQGLAVGKLNLPLDKERMLKSVQTCLQKRKIVLLDDLKFTKSGETGYLGFTLTPILDREGRAEGAIMLGRDITLRKIAEQQETQAQKLESVGQLAAGIAHELNTPIQFVGDNIDFLQESFGEWEEIVESLLKKAAAGTGSEQELPEVADVQYLRSEFPKALEEAKDGISRVAKIVKAMKDFSHPESGKKTDLDINRALENTSTICKSEWKYVADLKWDLSESLPSVEGFPDALNQVFLNLIVNSAQALQGQRKNEGGPKGTIAITTRSEGKKVLIKVEDTGPGIPAEIQRKVFDPFFTTKDVGVGTGQGLSISHDIIVKKHGGKLYFVSEEGKGTTFFIELPEKPPS